MRRLVLAAWIHWPLSASNSLYSEAELGIEQVCAPSPAARTMGLKRSIGCTAPSDRIAMELLRPCSLMHRHPLPQRLLRVRPHASPPLPHRPPSQLLWRILIFRCFAFAPSLILA